MSLTPSDNLSDFTLSEDIDKTYKIDIEKNRVKSSFIDKKEAVKQSSFLILNTERYECLLYSWNYGIETKDLIGKPIDYVYPELCERIKEALLQDSRITSVDSFSYEVKQKGKLTVYFTEHTIYGNIDLYKEVNL
ncbi:DUF2634 domain-containing protein [Clostridium butyricum]|uniref:DUF2634 domain-containing protein n=1 Tax=Clostridium butyricum TaxID=1492 RepID=UPI000426FF22|nr:DUF2634 domain-containing protein [Clostridium butyricum]